MHFCKFNTEFIGLGYKPYKSELNYGLHTFELYRCKKCKKIFFKREEFHRELFSEFYKKQVEYYESCGYKPLGDLINTEGE